MSATTATARGRVAAQALMQDTCTIRRATAGTTDPETGDTTPGTPTVVYSGACRVQQAAPGAAGQDVGQAHVYQVPLILQLPMSVTGVRVEDVATIDTCALDPDLAGRRFWIRGVAVGTHKTARRLPIELVTG
jgi:hypothetical protein